MLILFSILQRKQFTSTQKPVTLMLIYN